VSEPSDEELEAAAEWRRENFPGIAEPKSYNEAIAAAGGTPVGAMTHEEAKPIIAKMMRKFLKVPKGEPLVFNEQDFTAAVNAMPMEEYARKRQAIAAFRLHGD
jgi:hypothetical protein